MTNYREILRLSSLQYSQRTIESMAHCSRHTVRDVLQAAKEQGISWPLSDDVANADLEQLLFPNRHKASSQYAEPDYPYIHRELARSGVTLTLLWEEYCAKCQEAGQRPYMSTQFGERYRRWARVTTATMRIPAQAGGRHAGGLGWRYHPPPRPGHRRAKRRLLVCRRSALQLLHLRGSLRRHENRELVELPCPCIRLLRWRRTAADP